jgi:hypothetical protein
MRFNRTWVVAAALLSAGIVSTEATAQPVVQQWVRLGCQPVGFNVDRDVIRVGARDGRYRAIRLRAANNSVYMFDLKVVYGNGAPDDIPVRAEIPAGGQTRALDLRGQDRFIERIEMIYRSKPNFRGQATVCAEGLAVVAAGPGPGPGPGPGRTWVSLGCQRVGFNVDRDVIRVGRRDGAFRAIRLRAAGNDIYMFDLKVVYGNGAPDDIPVRADIRAGTSTGPLDLKGDRRIIERVELIYRSRPNFRGQAQICVDGAE